MSVFGTLMHRIFHPSDATSDASAPRAADAATAAAVTAAASPTSASVPPTAAVAPTVAGSTVATAAPSATTATPAPSAIGPGVETTHGVDVEAVLSDLARKHRQNLDWRTSIVDLMKLVGMDSSLEARKELARELGYAGDTSDSAAMNVWLHKQVMRKLADNGGKVPQNLLH